MAEADAQEPVEKPAAPAVSPAAVADAPAQDFDEVFKGPSQDFDEVFKPQAPNFFSFPTSMDASEWKTYLKSGTTGAIISAFGDAFTGPGLSDEVGEALRKAGVYNDAAKQHQAVTDSFAQGVFRPVVNSFRAFNEKLLIGPAVTAADALARGAEAILSKLPQNLGAEAEAEPAGPLPNPETWLARQIGVKALGRDVAAAGEMAMTFGHVIPGGPVLPGPIARSRAASVIGEGESGFFGTRQPSEADVSARAAAAGDIPHEEPAEAAAVREAEVPAAAAAPDVHAIAREVAPETFRQFDPLVSQRDSLAQWMPEIRAKAEANIEANPPEALQGLDAQISATERKVENAGARTREGFEDKLADLHDQRADMVADLVRGHPDVTTVRLAQEKVRRQMTDLAPEVSAAYREAATRVPAIEEPAAPPEAPIAAQPAPAGVQEPVAAPAVGEVAAPAVTAPVAPPPSGPVSTPEMVKAIAEEVTAKLMATGRISQEVAENSAQIVAQQVARRAERFKGALGSARDLYDREGSQIIAAVQAEPRGKARTKELAQSAGGSITYRPGNVRALIRLFQTADASTFIHESGHQFLEDLLRDADHPLALDDLKADAATVRGWLKTESGPVKTAGHEKWARGFERYMMEGIAPTKALASVFEKFKNWLTQIYQTVAKLRSPINDDIRDVFDRLLTKTPERATIAPELPLERGLADAHEVSAETTPAAGTGGAAHQVHVETAEQARAKAQEIVSELRLRRGEPAGEAGGGAPQRPGDAGGGDAAGNLTGENGGLPGPGAVVPGGGQAAPAGYGPPRPGDNLGPTRASGLYAKVPNRPPRLTDGAADAAAGHLGKAGFNPDAPWKAGADGKDLAGNIRLENLRTSDDIDDLLRAWARGRDDLFDARHNYESYRGQVEVEAARALLCDVAASTLEAERKLAQTGTETDAVALLQWRDRLNMVGDKVSTLAAGAGRTLAAFRKMDDAKAVMARLEGKTLFQLQNQARLNSTLDTPGQLAHAVRQQSLTPYEQGRSMLIEYYVNNLISGPITHGAYMVSNLVTALVKAGIEVPLAAGVRAVREAVTGAPVEGVHLAEAKAMWLSLSKGFRDGGPAAWQALKSGVPGLLEGEETAPQLPYGVSAGAQHAIPGMLGKIANAPSNVVTAIHTLGRTVNYEMEKAALIARQASKEGLEGDAFARRVAELDQKTPLAIMQEAATEATKMVLMDRAKWGSLTSKIANLSNSWLPLKLSLPFVQVGANLLHGGLVERTPIGLFEQQIRDNLMGKNGAAARDIQAGKIATGTAIALGVYSVAAEGLITGSEPKDSKQAALWRMSGKQEYSIRAFDHWVPYRKWLGWFGPLVGMAANVHEVGRTMEDQGLAAAATAAVFGFSEVVADESWFRGMSDFVNAAKHWDTEGERYIRNLATNFIPFSVGMSQVAHLVDPYRRRADGFMQQAQTKIPGLSEDLMASRDIFGEPLASHMIITPTRVNDDPVIKAMQSVNVWPRTVDKKIRGVELTGQQYDDYARIAGRLAKAKLDTIVNRPGFDQIPGHIRRKEMMDAVSHSREAARSTVITMSLHGPNDIAALARANKLAERADFDER